MNARIALALGASLALHAAALSYVVYKGMDRTRGLPASMTVPGSVMMARLVVDDKPAASPAVLAATLAAVDPVASQPDPRQRQTVAPIEPALAALAASKPSRPYSGPDALAGFIAATQLSSRPVAIFVGELEPDWLSEIKGAAVATVSVFVAADGSVFHVEVRKASNPRIAELVRKAFSDARFKPGMLQGQNVASRVDISLDYEDQRDRVVNPDAPRPADRILGAQDRRKGFEPPPDKSAPTVSVGK